MAKAREEVGAGVSGVGLCASCAHAARQKTARGGVFWRCLRADADPAYRRYPPLPVQTCPGHVDAGHVGSGHVEEGGGA